MHCIFAVSTTLHERPIAVSAKLKKSFRLCQTQRLVFGVNVEGSRRFSKAGRMEMATFKRLEMTPLSCQPVADA